MLKPKSNFVDGYNSTLTREYFKGKSINNAGVWKRGVRYFNDDFVVDLVTYRDTTTLPDGTTKTCDVILACNKSHISDAENFPVIRYDDHGYPKGVYGNMWTYMMCGGTNMTAYDIAVKYGYTGTEEEWIKQIEKQVVTSDEITALDGVPYLTGNGAVRFDIDQTEKNTDEKAQARKNINAPNLDDMVVAEKPEVDYYQACRTLDQIALVWEPQQLTNSQLTQAQENLHIADESRVTKLESKLTALDASGVTTIGDIRDLTTILWNNNRSEVPEYIVEAVNNLVDYIGDPDLDEVKINESTTNTIESINKLYSLITDKEHVLKQVPAAYGDTINKYTLYSTKTGLQVDGCDIIEVPRNNYIKEAFMVEGGIDGNNNYVAGGTGHRFIDFIIGYDKADPYTGKPYTKVSDLYICVDGLSYVGKDETFNTSATIQTATSVNGVTGLSEISANIIDGRVDRKHLTNYVNAELSFVQYAHEDADAPSRYVRCVPTDPDAVEVTTINKNTIFASIKNMDMDEIGTYVKAIDAGTQLNTEAQNLRDAVNELVQSYPVTIKKYENAVVDSVDGATATTGSKYTYVVKQSRDADNKIVIGTIEVPLAYHLVKIEHITAIGGEWLGDFDATTKTDTTQQAVAGDSLLKITVTNDAKDAFGNIIYQYLYTRLEIYTVKDEVTGKSITIDGTAYATPADVLAAFENDPQVQLYISGTDNKLSAKLIFEDDPILGNEIIP